MLSVVPHAGTWIEIYAETPRHAMSSVVPHAGTWIEMSAYPKFRHALRSFPTRERGLKLQMSESKTKETAVVPHAGTWIEIFTAARSGTAYACRSPRGNVD